MKRLLLVSALFLLPLVAQADPVTLKSGKTFTPDMTQVWTPEDPEARRLYRAYEQNFLINERRYQASRDAAIERIKNDPNLGAPEKLRRIERTERLYKARSKRNVAHYREPMLDKINEISNRGLGPEGTIRDTLGEKLFVTDPETGQRRYNPNHDGYKSDKDMGGSAKAADRWGRTVRHYFGDEVEDINGKRVKAVDMSGLVVEAPFLEATVNAAPEHYDPTTDTFKETDKLGSSARDAKNMNMARHPETYHSFSMEGQPGAKQVEAFDHFGKGIQARGMDATDHVRPENTDKVRPFYKSVNKMVGDLDEAEFNAIKSKTGYQGSFEDYKNQVNRLKHKASMGAVGVNEGNVKAFKATGEAVQDAVLDKNAADWEKVRTDEVKAIKAAEAELDGLKGEARAAKAQDIRSRKNKLADSQSRMNAVKTVADEARQGVPAPEKVTPLKSSIPDKPTLRARVNTRVEGMIAKGAPALGKIANGVEKVTWAYRVGSELSEGNLGGAAMEVGAIALEEVKDRAVMAVGEKIIPGYGNMKLAYDVGYGTGRLIGTYVKVYPGGPTVDEAAQNFFEQAHDIVSGNREKRWENKRIQDYHNFVNEMIDDWGAELPPGMTRGQALAYAIEQDNKGGNFHKSMEKLFAEGDKVREAREKERRELAEATRQAALRDVEAAKAKREAEEAKRRAAEKVRAAQEKKQDDSAEQAVGGLRALLSQKQEEAERAPEDTGGEEVNRMFDKGTETIGKYRRYEQLQQELKQAQRHLAETRARIAARERQREIESQQFSQSLSNFGQMLSHSVRQATQAYAQQKLKMMQQRQARDAARAARQRQQLEALAQGRDMSKPAWLTGNTETTTRRPATAAPAKPTCRKTKPNLSQCESAFWACMKTCPKGGKRAPIVACHEKCSAADRSCRKSHCPNGRMAGVGWNITCTTCR